MRIPEPEYSALGEWLAQAVLQARAAGEDAYTACLSVTEKLEAHLADSGRTLAVALDVWISSRFEECCVALTKAGEQGAFTIRREFVPIRLLPRR